MTPGAIGWCFGRSAKTQAGVWAALAVLCVVGPELQAISSSSGSTPITGLNINQYLGAERFYDAGYTGSRTIQANIEGGHIWAGHVTLGHATVRITGSQNQTREHATSVGHAMGGRSTTSSYPSDYHRWGMAPDATLWSGAVATFFDGSSFGTSNASVASVYSTILQTGVGGLTADVFNSSWGFASDAGRHTYNLGVDGLIRANGTVGVASVGNVGTAKVGGLAAVYNTISVAALGSATSSPPYRAVSSFSSRGPNDVYNPVTQVTHIGVRAAVDIAAPGQNLTLAAYEPTAPAGYRFPLQGTSFASPLVAGGASLLVDAGKTLYAAHYDIGQSNRATDGRVIKAVLLNSADKIPAWNNGQNSIGGVIQTTQSLDWASGAGRMNLSRAFDQYVHRSEGGQANTTDLFTGGSVAAVGWDFGELNLGEENRYYITAPLASGTMFTATLAWFIDRDSGSTADFSGNAEQRFANLDLTIFQFDNPADRNITGVIAESISLYNVVEHLHFALPADGFYGLSVNYTSDLWNIPGLVGEQYGLAWYGTAMPDPAAGLGILLVLLIMRRSPLHQSSPARSRRSAGG